jgi:hypothetical protein
MAWRARWEIDRPTCCELNRMDANMDYKNRR